MLYYLRRSILTFLLLVPALAQPTPISAETAHQATGYMEWMLDARFTAEQRLHYQQILAKLWSGSPEAISAMARANQTLAGLDEGQRSQLRAEKRPQFPRLLETASDEDSRWLLGIYRAAHSSSSAPLGRWTDGYISSIQYRDAVTGVGAPTNGRAFAYEFKADGTYSFTGLIQSVMYHCTTAIFSNESGTYTVEGDLISLRPAKNPYRMTNNCAPSSNRESPGKLVPRTYRFRVSNEGARAYLELRGDDGAVQKFGASR
jgi:hypothetical protein